MNLETLRADQMQIPERGARNPSVPEASAVAEAMADESPQPSAVETARVKFKTGSRSRLLGFAAAGLLVCCAYGLQVFFCANSALFYMPYKFRNSDMYANLLWAKSILEQGWLNPSPHHPYVFWMGRIGTYREWLSWWGNEAIYQQSPLYAYLLAAFQLVTDDLLYVHMLQALLGIALCAALGRIAFRIDGRPLTGWIAFGMAAAYAPFYAYSSALVRDILAWAITAWLLVVLLELSVVGRQWSVVSCQSETRQRLLAVGAGLLLGLGFLARETYALIVPVVAAVLAWRFIRMRAFSAAASFGAALIVVLAPLVTRNWVVGAPLLSTSNRFAEAFIQGNAGSAHSCLFIVPWETRQILQQSGGRALPVVRETLRTHSSVMSWMRLQASKVLSLMDPFESHDNLAMGFAERISPLVKWGLKHWMIITPGIGGLLLSLLRRDRRHFWLWILLPMLLAGILVGLPLSRYRQILAVLWIPWAAYLVVNLVSRQPVFATKAPAKPWPKSLDRLLHAGLALWVVCGWLLSLGPLAQVPRDLHDRPVEYYLSIGIYEQLGQADKAKEMRELFDKKFPDAAAAAAAELSSRR